MLTAFLIAAGILFLTTLGIVIGLLIASSEIKKNDVEAYGHFPRYYDRASDC